MALTLTENKDTFTTSKSNPDTIFALGGDDQITIEGNHNQTVWLGAGNDTVLTSGTPLGDIIIGGGLGDDNIDLKGNGNNKIYGGADANGRDTIAVTGDGDNKIFAGGGNDTVTVSGKGTFTIGVADGNDVVNVGNLAHAAGANGSSTVYAAAGDDTVNVWGKGTNKIYGGDGADSIKVTGEAVLADQPAAASNNTIYGGDGFDTINVGAAGVLSNGNNTIGGGAGRDEITVYGNGKNTVYGGLDSDTITVNGTGGNTVDGGVGNDDITVVGSGADKVSGGEGNDVIKVSGGGNDTVTGDAGNDTIEFTAQPAVLVGTTAAAQTATVDGGAGDDVITLKGLGAFADAVAADPAALPPVLAVVGNTLTLTVTAGDGKDTIDFSQANIVAGSKGVKYTVDAGAGDDRIIASDLRSADGNAAKYTGGAGNDVFDFSKVTVGTLNVVGKATITDFTSGQDKLDLTGLGVTAASIKIDAGSTVIDLDHDGNLATGFVVVLTGVGATTAADFIGIV